MATDFFETSAFLITFVLLGKFMECTAKGKTSEALTKLLQLAPDTSTLVVLDESGAVIEQSTISTSLVHKGDVLKVGFGVCLELTNRLPACISNTRSKQ